MSHEVVPALCLCGMHLRKGGMYKGGRERALYLHAHPPLVLLSLYRLTPQCLVGKYALKRSSRVLKGFMVKQTCLTGFTLIPSTLNPQKLDLSIHILLHCRNESVGNTWEIYFASSIQADSLLWLGSYILPLSR